MVKNLPTMQETQVQFLGWESALEKEMATHCSVLGKPHGQRSLSFLVLEHSKFTSASGLLHMLVPLPEHSSPKLSQARCPLIF